MHHMIRRDGERTVAKAPALHRVWTRLEPLKGHVRIIGGAIAYLRMSTARSIEDPIHRPWALRAIAEAQAYAGDMQGALSAAGSIEGPPYPLAGNPQARAFSVIANTQAAAGDTRGAERTVSEALSTARRIEKASPRAVEALSVIAEAQVAVGDTRGAERTVAEALSTARRIDDATYRVEALSVIAKTQVAVGDTRGAERTVAEALSTARSIEYGEDMVSKILVRNRAWALITIAEAQASTGDIQGALSIARSLEDGFYRARALSAIAKAQVDAAN